MGKFSVQSKLSVRILQKKGKVEKGERVDRQMRWAFTREIDSGDSVD